MNTKPVVTALSIIVVVLFVAVLGFYALQTYQAGVSTELTQLPDEPQKFTVQEKTITDNTKPFTINITYPEVVGIDGFNQKIQAAVGIELSEFKKNALANDEAVKQTDPEGYAENPRTYDFRISYTKGQIDGNVISVMLNVESYEGGAHGSHYFIPVNYDVKTGNEITLETLSAGKPDYLKTISEFSTKELEKQLTANMGSLEGTWVKDGTAPKEENFSVFLVNKDSVTFYFSEYQVAPYVAGSFTVVMPR